MSAAPKNKIVNLPSQEIIFMYLSGVSENMVSKHYSVSRNVIRRILNENNVQIRGQSEAEKVKWSRMTIDQRSNQVRGCHDAVRGRPSSDKHRENIALARERLLIGHFIGVGEIDFKHKLSTLGIKHSFQKAILSYNLDFLVFGVDIELTTFTGKNSQSKQRPKDRAINIFNATGFHTLAIELRDAGDIELFFDRIMREIARLSFADKSHCLYWVATCTDSGFNLREYQL